MLKNHQVQSDLRRQKNINMSRAEDYHVAMREVESRKAEASEISQRLDGMVHETNHAMSDVHRQRELCHQIHEANQRKSNELNAQQVEL